MTLGTDLSKLSIETRTGTDYGVAYMADGKLRGGDSGMAYVGTYRIQGDKLTAELCITQHRHVPGVVSALGYNDLTVQLDGVAGDYSADVRGTSKDVPSVKSQAKFSHIAD